MNVLFIAFNVFLIAGLIALPLLKEHWLPKTRNLLFFFISIVFYLVNKIPIVFKNHATDADAAINIAEASILRFHDPILWRSVDFFTIGPLHIASFLIPSFFGFPLDYTNVRFVWLFENLISLSFIFMTLSLLFKANFKYYAFLISLLIFGFGNNPAFNHFNNESLSILILSICIYMLFREIQLNNKKNQYDILFYFLLGLCPYSKLQSVPIAFALFVVLLIFRLYFQKKSLIHTVSKSIFFALLPSLILFVYLIYFNQLETFYYLYLKTNFNYESSSSTWGNFLNIFLVRANSTFPINYFLKHFYFLVFLGLSLFVVINRMKDFKAIAIWILCFSTIYSIIKPGFAYNHYFTYLLLSFPLCISMVLEKIPKSNFIPKNFTNLSLILIVILLSFLNLRVYAETNYFKDFPTDFKKNKIVISRISAYLIETARKLNVKPQIVVFDWKPQIYVETGFLSATHQNIPERLFGDQVVNEDILNYSRDLYLNDIKKNKPVFFIIQSSKSKEYYNFTYKKLSTVKDLKTYFDNNYIKINEIDSNEIFVRKDLFESINQ